MGLTAAEAAEILDIAEGTVHRYVAEGRLSKDRPYANAALDRDQVEELALSRLRRGQPHPYWASTTEAAALLGVTKTRVRQLAERGRIPGRQRGRTWFFRQAQLEVVANAREARALERVTVRLRTE
ncbi:helix-turn-helix domain-containing protein [Nocardioides mesophilus]|uniref:Helix-turn-helix domain-containing protein n=1 Tax=Nocardioides mesophilus TaxID=433659 RepID=A0A7G9RGI0_9ACTN|nr:helix-turn-helix domain-containing protein [Nocardioides mesophilus]QNN54705.1 helix-turn-helix domain-containing protein [Nocardioides mesophilus]